MPSKVYPARRGRPGSEATRQRIVDTVRDLLAAGEFHEATVESIAARAGVARSTLHLHFGSRMGLIDAICERLAVADEYAGIRSSLELPDPADAVRSLLAASVRFWAAEEPLHRSLYGLAEIDPAARAFVERQTGERRAELRRLSRRLHEADALRGGLSADDAFAMLLVATSFGAFDELRRNAKLTAGGIERAAGRVADALLAGS